MLGMIETESTVVFLGLKLWCCVVQSLSLAACQTPPSSTLSQRLLKFTTVESVMLSNHLILYHPLLLLLQFQSFPAPGSIPMSRLFLSGGQSTGASALASVLPEYSGLISFRIDWFALAVQGTLKSLLQHHTSKASVLWCSASLWSNSHTHTWLLEKP